MWRLDFSRLLKNLSHGGEVLVCFRETEHWLPLTLAYLRLKPLEYPYAVGLRSGERLSLEEDTDLTIFWMVFARQHYPVRASDRVILDIGANVGFFSIFAARQAPQARVVALEPFPATRRRLTEHLAQNRLNNRVAVFDYALGESPGNATMDNHPAIPSQYRRIHSEMTKSLNLSHRRVSAAEQAGDGISIQVETLEGLMNTAGVSVVDLLKMNIHGSEYSVLMSTPSWVLRRCHRIAVQYHELPENLHLGKRELFGYLAGAGFKLVVDRDTHRGSGLAVLEQAGYLGMSVAQDSVAQPLAGHRDGTLPSL